MSQVPPPTRSKPTMAHPKRPPPTSSALSLPEMTQGAPPPSLAEMMRGGASTPNLAGPISPPSELQSPEVAMHGRNSLIASSAIRHVQRVSKQAALNTKKQIWDSNDASIVAAQNAVDQWEQGYSALRGLLFAIGDSAKGLYGAAKTGASGLEHGFLVPVRDWVLLPAFGGVEKVAGETIGFLQSEQAQELAHHSLGIARQIPFVGESLVAPALCIGAEALHKTWEVIQYPIPSPNQVRDSVDFVMTGTKWALSSAGREISLYAMRADANITRTLSHTQWKVLGSGPYATLDKLNKKEVIDHLCERYFDISDAVLRYELAAHVRAHNRPLYHDLVVTGLLRDRGGNLTSEDEWLSSRPKYVELEAPFLLDDQVESGEVFSLWFRLPYFNGRRPRRDTPWVQFTAQERNKLERFYRWILRRDRERRNIDQKPRTTTTPGTSDPKEEAKKSKYASTAKWYDHDSENDLLLDQKRHAVSFFPCCPKCRQRHAPPEPPLAPKAFGQLCDVCAQLHTEQPWVDAVLSPPPVIMRYRPTLWRFYGPGDELRRATWFVDTPRQGLQPYGDDAQAVLEDAYLFLKWTARRRVWDGGVLLTVEVPSPDGAEQQLVQFSSINFATAIGKGLGSAIALFKRRVYRGAYNGKKPIVDPDTDPSVLDGDEMDEESSTEVDDPGTSDEESLNGLSIVEEDGSDENLSTARRALESQLDAHSHKIETTPPKEVDRSVIVDGDDGEDWLQLKQEESQEAFPQHENHSIEKSEPESRDSIPVPLTSEDAVEVNEDGERNEMSIYTDEIKSLRIRLSRPLDEHLLLAYDLLQQEDENAQSIEEIQIDYDGSDDVDHLVLIVHGIGEMLQSVNLFGLSKLPTIADCCGFLRKNHSEVLEVRFNQLYKKLDGIRLHRKGPGRVEYLPVEWHDSFKIQSQRNSNDCNLSMGEMGRNYNINDISLRTVPQLRQFANDSLMDVLFFMSPEHHDTIVDIVVNEMNFVVERFRALTGFQGDVSLVGHSLGSIITWDILDNQRGFRESLEKFHKKSRVPAPNPSVSSAANGDFSPTISEERQGTDTASAHSASNGGGVTKGEKETFDDLKSSIDGLDRSTDTGSVALSNSESSSSPKPDYPQLSFQVDNAFMLGSPIAVFLMIRNQRQPLSLDFKLSGCSQVFNIFHPYDPVAYRIEPLLDPRNADVEPKIMTHWHGGFRFQYQTKLLWKKIVEETVKTQENVVASLESGIAALGLLDENTQFADEDHETGHDVPVEPHTVVTGSLNTGNRVDYMLQEKELESANEYVAALAAHSCYWLEKDLSLFIARQICLRSLEKDGDGEQLTPRKMIF